MLPPFTCVSYDLEPECTTQRSPSVIASLPTIAVRFIDPIFGKARYPDLYAWYVLASSLDIMLTYLIVWKFGGRELNVIAQQFIDMFGHWGLILLKYSTVVLVVFICEVVGNKRERIGKALAIAAIGISAMPVGVAILQFMAWTHTNLIEVNPQTVTSP